MSSLISTRDAYGDALVEIGGRNKNVVVLDSDVSICTKTSAFHAAYPNRFFNMGISEADMMATAAGLATCGKVAFVSTFAVFAAGRAYDQIRNSIAYPNLSVKICATHSGVSVGEDGASHQSIEDIALMRALPNMRVVSPADAVETKAAVHAALHDPGPWYIRLGRSAQPLLFTAEDYSFQLGKGITMREGRAITIIATGPMVAQSMKAATLLEEKGIDARVVNIHTIKPIDEDIILQAARETGAIITVEDHNVIGGLGSAVAEVLVRSCPVRMRFVGVQDRFGVSGGPDELYEILGLSAEDICKAAVDMVNGGH